MRYLQRGFRLGRATPELRQLWAENQLKAVRPELQPEILGQVDALGTSPQQSSNSNLESLVIALQQQVVALTQRLTGETPALEPAPVIEPKQLKLL